jgi:hypothetical protein
MKKPGTMRYEKIDGKRGGPIYADKVRRKKNRDKCALRTYEIGISLGIEHHRPNCILHAAILVIERVLPASRQGRPPSKIQFGRLRRKYLTLPPTQSTRNALNQRKHRNTGNRSIDQIGELLSCGNCSRPHILQVAANWIAEMVIPTKSFHTAAGRLRELVSQSADRS